MPKPYLKFLTELSLNNHKEWMDANRDWYQAVRNSFLDDVKELLFAFAENDMRLAMLEPKQCVFRQNRDIRFSKNKAPYKTNMGAYIAVGGKKSNFPGYYLHLEPDKSFIAGGLWMPASDMLKSVREEIAQSGDELKAILEDEQFQEKFKALEGEKLKKAPKGFEIDHPYVEYLKHKSFIVSASLGDHEVESGAFVQTAMDAYFLMNPFIAYLENAIPSDKH